METTSLTAGHKTSGQPLMTININADMTSVLAAIDDYMQELNQLQLVNSGLMQQRSQQEVDMNNAFEQRENAPPSGNFKGGTLYQLEHATDSGAISTLSANYQDENSQNQAAVKNVDSMYQMWQAATNQNNNNQQPIMAVGSAIIQFISNFLRYIHN